MLLGLWQCLVNEERREGGVREREGREREEGGEEGRRGRREGDWNCPQRATACP